jgi:hypothetical protein
MCVITIYANQCERNTIRIKSNCDIKLMNNLEFVVLFSLDNGRNKLELFQASWILD